MRFQDKPVAQVDVLYNPNHEQNSVDANRIADHLEEHLGRAGFTPDVGVRESDHVIKTGFYTDDIETEHFTRIAVVVGKVSLARIRGQLQDVFGLDNPENAAYNDAYAPEVTVEQARIDTVERERLFDVY